MKQIIQISLLSIFVLIESSCYAVINFSGTGSVEIAPDMANFDIMVETSASTAKEAAVANAEQTDKLVTLLKNILKEENAVTTANYEIFPDYQYNETTKKSEFVNFKTRNQVNVRTTNLAGLGDLLDQATSVGVTGINNLHFSYSKPEEVYLQALEKAVVNAKNQANVIAQAAGVKIKNIKSIDSYSAFTPMPVYASRSAGGANKEQVTMAAMSASAPINPDNVKTEATVNMSLDTVAMSKG